MLQSCRFYYLTTMGIRLRGECEPAVTLAGSRLGSFQDQISNMIRGNFEKASAPLSVTRNVSLMT